MTPRSHDQSVGGGGAVLFQRIEKLERAGEILGVEPSAHPEHGGGDVLHVRRLRARLPVLVVSGVFDGVVPIDVGVLQVLLVSVGDGAHAEEEIVGVHGAGVEAHGLNGALGLRLTGQEAGVEAEVGGEVERAVVIAIVAVADVAHRGLRGDGFEGGVGVHESVGGEEAGVGDAPHADLAVVVGHVLDEPVDGVEGVGAFVGVLGSIVAGLVGADVDEDAFGHVAAADIFIDEDEAFLFGGHGRADLGLVVIGAVRSDAVRRALHDDGVGLRGVLGDVGAGEEADSVAHGDAVFVLGVVGLGVGEVGAFSVGEGLRNERLSDERCRKEQADGRQFSYDHAESVSHRRKPATVSG